MKRKKILLFLILMGFPVTLQAFLSLYSTGESETSTTLIKRIVRATAIIDRNYYDPNRIKPETMLEDGLHSVSNLIPEMLVEFPKTSPKQLILSVGNFKQSIPYEPPKKIFDLLKPLSAVFSFLEKHRSASDMKPEDREYAFIGGMLKSLDPHSNVLPPNLYKEFKTQTSGEYGGIGVVVSIKEDELTVIAPVEGTPAARASLETDDKILQIDDLSTINMPLSEAVEHLRGKIGTKVTLILRKKNGETREVSLVRQTITIESVRSKLVVKNKKRFGIISLRGFQEDTYTDFEKALRPLTILPLDGLVLDVRNNPGGLLEPALEIADKFLDRGELLYTVGADNTNEEITRATKGNDLLNVPLIVLVNEGSASASEIVAGALKNTNRALVLGNQTFGKGSVQSLFSLQDGASIKLTIAQYLTPGRLSIQAVGITPDVQLTPSFVTNDEFDLREDEFFGEKSLDEHLENHASSKKVQPFFKFRYLQKEKTERETDYIIKIDEKSDYPLGLALMLLAQVNTPNKSEMIRQGIPTLKTEALEQDRLVTLALKKYSIDWTPANQGTSLSPNMIFSSLITNKKTGTPISTIHAGDEITWTLTQTNTGKEDLHRLMGVVHSENPLLNEREFVFGVLKAGQSSKAKINVTVPKSILSYEEKVSIDFFVDQGTEQTTYHVMTKFLENAAPAFAYRYQLKDDGLLGSKGNGNLLPEKGETLAFEATLKNLSSNAANEVVFNLKNVEGEGIFLKEGRATVPTMAGGSEITKILLFQIAPEFSKNEMSIDFSALDRNTRQGIADSISFSLESPARFEPPQNKEEIPPSISLEETIFKENEKKIFLKGTVKDDRSLHDTMIFVNGKKAFYRSENQVPLAFFSVELLLEEGANVISIQARDSRKMLSRKSLSVVVPKNKRVGGMP